MTGTEDSHASGGRRRLVFLGTPEAAVPPLQALVADGHDVALVVSQPDRRRGRGGALSPSPAKAAATSLGIPVTHRVDDVLDVGAELGVVVAFGKLIKPHVLDVLPMVNVHFSLLPRWRGAAPVERAILAGDEVTGVCLMGLEEELDTGPVYGRVTLPIGAQETADELRARLVAAGTELLVDLLRRPLPPPVPQEGEPTYAHKIEPHELRLDWSRPAAELERLCRVGGAWTTFRGGRLKVRRARARTEAESVSAVDAASGLAPGKLDGPGPSGGVVVGTGRGALELMEVQPEGKPSRPAAAWRHGAHLAVGECLGT